jgi:peptidoglycan-associated lipoprotein
MTLHRRGRGGWVNKGGRAASLVGLVALGFVVGTGCSSKTKGVGGEGNPVGSESNLGSQGSLEQFKNTGTLSGSGPLTDIHFGYNTYNIEPQDGSILKQNASWLQSNPRTRVQVEGHCDERGSEEYKIALGAKRAQAAKDYLETLGVEGGRISTISYGKELPLCTDHDESCWEQNRRDHFVVQQ